MSLLRFGDCAPACRAVPCRAGALVWTGVAAGGPTDPVRAAAPCVRPLRAGFPGRRLGCGAGPRSRPDTLVRRACLRRGAGRWSWREPRAVAGARRGQRLMRGGRRDAPDRGPGFGGRAFGAVMALAGVNVAFGKGCCPRAADAGPSPFPRCPRPPVQGRGPGVDAGCCEGRCPVGCPGRLPFVGRACAAWWGRSVPLGVVPAGPARGSCGAGWAGGVRGHGAGPRCERCRVVGGVVRSGVARSLPGGGAPALVRAGCAPACPPPPPV